jgi:hypothetical protein
MVAEYGAPYMRQFKSAARGSTARAVLLQEWNVEIGAAFHAELGSVEIALRRRADDAFTAEFGAFWWNDHRFIALAPTATSAKIASTVSRLTPAQRLDHHAVVAELAFGTWVALVRGRFFDRVWRHHLCSAFPHLHPRPFADIAAVAQRLLALRNAIGHHRPVVRRPLRQLHDDVLKILGWMSMPLQVHAAASSAVPRLLLTRP